MAESIVVSCPSCGKKYRISPEKMGKTFKCTGCENRFQAGAEMEPAAIAPPPPPPMPEYEPEPQFTADGTISQNKSKAAVASLILGIAFCIPGAFIAAIICGAIGLSKTGPGKLRGRGMAITGLSLGIFWIVVGSVGGVILRPALLRAVEVANRAKCGINLHKIGGAYIHYEAAHNNKAPHTLTELWKDRQSELSGSDFVCPSSTDTPALDPSQLETGGHCSYTLIYPGKKSALTESEEIIAYEKISDHKDEGGNAVFGDGHAEWFPTAQLNQLVAKSMADAK